MATPATLVCMRTLPTRGQVAIAAAAACVAVGLVLRSAAEPLAAHVVDLAVGAVAAGVASRAFIGVAHVRRAVLAFLIIGGVGLSHVAYAGPVFTLYEVLVLATALAFDRVPWWKGFAVAFVSRAAGIAAFYALLA